MEEEVIYSSFGDISDIADVCKKFDNPAVAARLWSKNSPGREEEAFQAIMETMKAELVRCAVPDFSGQDSIFQCGGGSKFLNTLCANTRKSYTLTVYYSAPYELIRTRYTGTANKPPESSYCNVIRNWKSGYDLGRAYCVNDGTWYWVKYPIVLTPEIGFMECTRAHYWLAAAAVIGAGAYYYNKKRKARE